MHAKGDIERIVCSSKYLRKCKLLLKLVVCYLQSLHSYDTLM